MKDSKTPSIWYEVTLIDGQTLWFINGFGTGLFKMNLETGAITYICSLPAELYPQRRIIGSIVRYKDILIMAPFHGTYFVEYHLKTGQLISVKTEIANAAKFGAGVLIGEEVFFIGSQYPGIAKYQPKDHSVKYLNIFQEHIKLLNPKNFLFKSCVGVQETNILIPFCDSNEVIKFDTATGKHSIKWIETNKNGFNNIIEWKQQYWLVSRYENKLVKWDGNSSYAQTYWDESMEALDPSVYTITIGEWLIVAYCKSLTLYMINMNDGLMQQLPVFYSHDDCFQQILSHEQKLLWIGAAENSIYLLTTIKNALFKIDIRTLDVSRIPLVLENTQFSHLKEDILAHKMIWDEKNSICDIEFFMDRVSKATENTVEKKYYGEIIYNKIKNQL